jgi:hypothetical protein
MPDLSPEDVAARHVVPGRRCTCPRHFGDGLPEFCTPAYRCLAVSEQHDIADHRAGIASADGEASVLHTPDPYEQFGPYG